VAIQIYISASKWSWLTC